MVCEAGLGYTLRIQREVKGCFECAEGAPDGDCAAIVGAPNEKPALDGLPAIPVAAPPPNAKELLRSTGAAAPNLGCAPVMTLMTFPWLPKLRDSGAAAEFNAKTGPPSILVKGDDTSAGSAG